MYYRAYQRLFSVLLCDQDPLVDDGRGKPVKRAWYGDCFLLESTGLTDKNRNEIFEGDVVKINYKEKSFTGVVNAVPDTFGAGKIHPLRDLLQKNGISGYPENLDMEVVGNEFENPGLIKK